MSVDSYQPAEYIEDLDLVVRAFNILKREGITRVAALTMMCETDLMDLRSFDDKCLLSVQEGLARHGLKLRPKPTEPFTDVIEVEHVTVYRWGAIQVTVNGAGEVLLSSREFSSVETQALCAIFEKVSVHTDEHKRRLAEWVETLKLSPGEIPGFIEWWEETHGQR